VIAPPAVATARVTIFWYQSKTKFQTVIVLIIHSWKESTFQIVSYLGELGEGGFQVFGDLEGDRAGGGKVRGVFGA
jgi:hypothetical protein